VDVGRIGDDRHWYADLYHSLTSMSWPLFFSWFALVFFLFNLMFAALYQLDPHGLTAIGPQDQMTPFARAFFFSVHTVATVGYGNVYPVSWIANLLVVVEIACGILVFALTSGLVFARFSRPTARVLFSNVVVVREFQGVPTLMLRAANQRTNFILEASVRVSILRTERNGNSQMRRFYDLPLERPSSPFFSLSWLIMHKIDEGSPLYGMDQSDFESSGDEIAVLLTGIDASVAQPIHARHAYGPGHVRWNHDFADVISVDDLGRRWIDFTKFHNVLSLEETNMES